MKLIDYTGKRNFDVKLEVTMEFLLNHDDIKQLLEMKEDDQIYVNGRYYTLPHQNITYDILKKEQLIKLKLILVK